MSSIYHSAKTGIDFYLPLQNTAIQVAWTLSDSSYEREINALVKMTKATPDPLRLVIVTYEEKNGFEIEVVPLLYFLLNA